MTYKHHAMNEELKREGMFYCECCGEVLLMPMLGKDTTTGYGIDREGGLICFHCAGKKDREDMRRTGKARLYMRRMYSGGYVSNWSGTFSITIPSGALKRSRHNIAGWRYDVWFPFDGYLWHGVQYGDNTMIVHCKRTKTGI